MKSFLVVALVLAGLGLIIAGVVTVTTPARAVWVLPEPVRVVLFVLGIVLCGVGWGLWRGKGAEDTPQQSGDSPEEAMLLGTWVRETFGLRSTIDLQGGG